MALSATHNNFGWVRRLLLLVWPIAWCEFPLPAPGMGGTSLNGFDLSDAAQVVNSDPFYPKVIGSVWVYQEQKEGKSKSVTIDLEKPVTVNQQEALFFKCKNCGLSYVVACQPDGVYLLKSNRPFLGLLDIGIDFTPPLKILGFPLKAGDHWEYHGRAGNWLDSKKVDVKYTNEGVEERSIGNKTVKAYRIVAIFKIGDKPPITQTTWYGEGVGYMGSLTADTQSVLTDCLTPNSKNNVKP